MLKRGTDPDHIPLYVRYHNIAKETDDHQDLIIIEEMAATELQVNTAVAGKRNWLIKLIKVSTHTEAQAKWAQEFYDGLITSPDQDENARMSPTSTQCKKPSAIRLPR